MGEHGEVDKHSTRIGGSDESMISEDHRLVSAVELLIGSFEEFVSVCGDFHGID